MTAPLAYTTNTRNRMSALSGGSPARTATYIYNALEQMISRQSNAAGAPTTIVHYIYDLDGHLIAEANGSLSKTTVGFLREYIWLPANDNAANDNVPDLPLAVIDVAATPTISQVHTDHLGRPVRVTSATKATTWNTVWTPWGAAHTTTGTATNNLRFPGQYFLIETSLAYNWHRSYDAATGRYTQADPLRFVDGPSVYAYAGNSPFMVTDPDGRCPVCVAIVVGALVGVAMEYALNGDCATAGDYALAAGLGAIPWGNVFKGARILGSSRTFRSFLANDSGAVSWARSKTVKQNFLKNLANDKGTPQWMKPWLKKGRVPPGYNVDHKIPGSVGGADAASNMRLVLQADHVIHHRFYRPW